MAKGCIPGNPRLWPFEGHNMFETTLWAFRAILFLSSHRMRLILIWPPHCHLIIHDLQKSPHPQCWVLGLEFGIIKCFVDSFEPSETQKLLQCQMCNESWLFLAMLSSFALASLEPCFWTQTALWMPIMRTGDRNYPGSFNVEYLKVSDFYFTKAQNVPSLVSSLSLPIARETENV